MKNNLWDMVHTVNMSKYIKEKYLGEGTFGMVYKGLIKSTKEQVALKIYDISDYEKEDLLSVFAEVMILINVNHTNIIRYRDIELGENTLTIVTELMSTNLRKLCHVQGDNKLPVKHASKCIRHISRGLSYLHEKIGLPHCDLKPDNILYNNQTNVYKIIDFNSVNIPNLHTTAGCTIWYRAPESLSKSEIYTIKSDIWSLGCILYEILTGKVIFPKNSKFEMLIEIARNIQCPDDCKFMEDYIQIKPTEKRLELVKNENAQDLLRKMLVINPEKRLTAKQVLEHPFMKE